MKKLSPDEKERIAFRAELLTLICSVGSLLNDIHARMHETPEERDEQAEKDHQDFADHIDSNQKFFAEYLREARSLPDDEGLFFKELAQLRDMVDTKKP